MDSAASTSASKKQPKKNQKSWSTVNDPGMQKMTAFAALSVFPNKHRPPHKNINLSSLSSAIGTYWAPLEGDWPCISWRAFGIKKRSRLVAGLFAGSQDVETQMHMDVHFNRGTPKQWVLLFPFLQGCFGRSPYFNTHPYHDHTHPYHDHRSLRNSWKHTVL